MGKTTKAKRGRSKDRAKEARDLESTVRVTCRLHRIDLRVSKVRCAKREIPHWRFIRDGFVLLQYWPSNGRYLTADGASGILLDMHMTGTLARYMATETDPSEDAALQALGAIG